jgi:hypothetical protein
LFRKGEKTDFERMLTDTVDRAKTNAHMACVRVQSEFTKLGAYGSSAMPLSMERSVTPIHEKLLTDAMRLLVEFSESTGISVSELVKTSQALFANFTSDVVGRIAAAAGHISPSLIPSQVRERFQQRTENALKDVEIGFIYGISAMVTENSTNQGKAMRLLQALYDTTRNQTEPVFISTLNTGLSEPEAQAAWRYLENRGLIDTFSIPYTARINASGVDAIESAMRRPDQPSTNFPSVSYSIVYNTMHIGAMHNSPIQQGGVNSTQTQDMTYGPKELGDLYRLVTELTTHLDELSLDAKQRQKAEAQIATIKAQLSDDPDPVIVKQAGRTLRNITEGAIGSLAAAAVQPTVWVWMQEAMTRLFG